MTASGPTWIRQKGFNPTLIQPHACYAPHQGRRHGVAAARRQRGVNALARNYPDPWRPRTFQAWIVKNQRVERVTDRATREVRRRKVDCWDVKGKADGIQWFKRFRRAGLAETWKERAERDFARGFPFDLKSKQFLEPERPVGLPVPTVFELTERYFRQHPEWEPETKTGAARSFNRARRWFLEPGAEPTGDELVAVEDFLTQASFLPAHLEGRMTDRQRIGTEPGWRRTPPQPTRSPRHRSRPLSATSRSISATPASGYRPPRSRGISNRSRHAGHGR